MEPMNASPDSLRERELDVAREIANAFLTAGTPVEVYRLALARVTPLVRASFSSVFERDPQDPTLLKLTCANNWPQSSARYLGQLRLRVGRGPTGRAVARRQPVEVSDVFADPALREWHEPARELGFVSLISLPLATGAEATGALTFYFDEPHEFDDDERHLLTLIADQLAVASGRVAALQAERRELEELRTENAVLRRRLGAGAEAKRLSDEFLANISHELRTPLTSILGYANLLTDGQAGSMPDAQRNTVLRIERSANALLHLINDLLELSQIKLDRAAVTIAPDDAVLLARRALDSAGRPRDTVQVTLDAESERLPIMTDGEKVVKILENLLSNAYKFTERGAVDVAVRSTFDDGRPAVEWIVTDTGIGIAQEKQDAIFDEFRQVDGSSTRLYGGTGLGLALCRSLARLLGGRITVTSEPGRGARFRLMIPAVR
ncbi:MAG TPA: GAF domain-containing sensor histidine kinase [Longimicrobiales bacterium]|nr:GAF domain-containing sensor histidine kinase [Longimicrobiales bacterium]